MNNRGKNVIILILFVSLAVAIGYPTGDPALCGNGLCEGDEAYEGSLSYCKYDCAPGNEVAESEPVPLIITYAAADDPSYWAPKTEQEIWQIKIDAAGTEQQAIIEGAQEIEAAINHAETATTDTMVTAEPTPTTSYYPEPVVTGSYPTLDYTYYSVEPFESYTPVPTPTVSYYPEPVVTGSYPTLDYNYYSVEPFESYTPAPTPTASYYPSASYTPYPAVAPEPGDTPYPDFGHADRRHITLPGFREYDIFVDNCHTAANEFCLIDPTRSHQRGILVCGGDPQNSPAHHTANWEIIELPLGITLTCIYNWGQSRCWLADSVPPDVTNEPGRTHAQWACGSQFGGGTRVLPPGETVEIPGYSACVRETAGIALNSISVAGANFSSDNQSACSSCCFRRAAMWSGYGNDGTDADFYQERAQFLTQCRTLCNGFFNNGGEVAHVNDSLGINQGRQCAANVATFSFSSYYEQCRGCCYDAAIGNSITRSDVSSCMAVCNSEYR